MATAQQQYDFSQDPIFFQRVQALLCLAAVQISTESSGETNYANRMAHAKYVLGQPAGAAVPWCISIVTDGTISALGTLTNATVTDTMISNAISGQWNAHAGVV
jgi:hypothetical protein